MDVPTVEQIERAARKYCELLDLDPNEEIPTANGNAIRHVLVAPSIVQSLAMKLALNEL